MDKFCGNCGNKLDEKTGCCPKCKSRAAKEKLKKKFPLFFILLVICIGSLIYYLINQNGEVAGYFTTEAREIPETDTRGFSYYETAEENVVVDSETGLIYVNNEILITLTDAQAKTSLENVLNTIGGKIVGEIEELYSYQVQLAQELSYEEIKKIVDELQKEKWAKSVSAHYGLEMDTQEVIPNDKEWKNKWDDIPYDNNWGMEAIDAPKAWEYIEEMQEVNIGILDTMFDIAHEDLIFAEQPLGNIKALQTLEFNDHGTHVAGTIGATFNNKKGVTGVAVKHNLYGSSFYGIQQYKYSTIRQLEIALYYLIASKECKVVNVSMGMDQVAFEVSREGEYYTEYLEQISTEMGKFLEALLEADYDFVICKSAGNLNDVLNSASFFRQDKEDEYPGDYHSYNDWSDYLEGKDIGNEDLEKAFERYIGREDEVEKRKDSGNVDAKYDMFAAITIPEVENRIIVVGAVQNKGYHKENTFLGMGGTKVHDGYSVASFSQCGKRVDVVAPGVYIHSAIKGGYCEKNEDTGLLCKQGTSMATPHVAGVAGLVYSINPDLRGDQVKAIICSSTTGEYGDEKYGLVNAGNAVKMAKNILPEDSIEKIEQLTNKGGSEERDIVLVLDTSGSMDGIPMEETKKASRSFVETVLQEEASVGIVTYSVEAKIRSNFLANELVLNNVVDSIYANDRTNIEDGLKKAYSLLQRSNAKKKMIVLMSDGLPTAGKDGEELISYARDIRADGINIYTLGFFELLDEKSQAQYLMEHIASDGCHYEVSTAEDLEFFFGDIADQISGQQYMYIRIACPVDVAVTYEGETLSSEEENLNIRTSFGTLTFEEGETGDSENKIKILRLKNENKYEIAISGNGRGTMDYTIGFEDENGEYSDFRRFKRIPITRRTKISTVAEASKTTVLKVDEDGDGWYDLKYKAGENEFGELEDNSYIIYISGSIVLVCLVMGVGIYCKLRKRGR